MNNHPGPDRALATGPSGGAFIPNLVGAPGALALASTPDGNPFIPGANPRPGFVSQPGRGQPPAFATGQPNAMPNGAGRPNLLPGQPQSPNPLPAAGMPGFNTHGMAPRVDGMAVPNAVTIALPGAGGVLAGVAGAVPRGAGGPPMPMMAPGLGQPPTLAAATLLTRPLANAPVVQPSQGLANPRAEAAAAALQGKAPSAPAVNPDAGQAASVAKPGPLTQPPAAPQANPAAAAGRPAPGALGSAQAVAQAQAALALALGKVTTGQTTAGTGAMVLAEAQLALRASKLALTQVNLAAQAQRVGGMASAKAGEPPPAAVQANAAMPRALAAALARAPKLRKRGRHDRVEAVDRHTPRQQAPEMEDEDFWDGAHEDDGVWDESGTDGAQDADAQRAAAAQAAAQHYRAMRIWLQANNQHVLLRELAAGRQVLVLAPPDKTHLRLIGHLLRPDAAGATGRAWALAARWQATLPADTQWRQWRLRQGVDTGGGWHIGASQPDRHTPRLVAANEAAAPALPAVGEHIVLTDPRRLRRLMGAQWTMTVLRVPVPLNDSAPAAEAA